MSQITTPRELFLHELGDILYVEKKLANEVLPKLISEVSDDEFRNALEEHLEQTRGHVANVKKVFEQMDETPHAEECLGFEGLKAEHDKMVSETANELVDSVDLGAAARTENYEIAAYEGLRRMAKAMGRTVQSTCSTPTSRKRRGSAAGREDLDPREQREREGARVARSLYRLGRPAIPEPGLRARPPESGRRSGHRRDR